jgi:TonB-linked SusC/RagA family outer membrane protein
MRKQRFVLALAGLLVALGLNAQDITVKGTVKDNTGEPVIGAGVVVKGTTRGTSTDIDGNYTLACAPDAVLEFSFIGMETQNVAVGGRRNIDVTLAPDSEFLTESVVTALGITREKKTLGYAIQDVGGATLLDAHEANLANALTGKVAGVEIIRSSNGPGASSRIVLRGNNSLTSLNQPLIVVDGVPMDNFVGASNNDFWNPSADMGSGLQDINPEDVESMTVLKGASAAALYGSRAGNGVILITTKKGRQNPGLGITVNSTVAFTTEFTRPAMQNQYGQGTLGEYNNTSALSWGPKITGQSVTKWDGSITSLQAFDNVKGFFGTGITDTENVTFSQQYGKTGIYASWTRTFDQSQVPGATLGRNNMMLRGTSTFGKNDKWHFDGKIQYIRIQANNRPISGSNVNANYMLKMYTMPVSVNIVDFKDAVDKNGEMFFFGPTDRMGSNPWWYAKYSTNQDVRNRFLMNASLAYDFTDWLSLELKAGSDMYFTETENKFYAGNKIAGSVTGSYGVGESRFYENNFSFLFKAQQDNIWGDLGASATLGGNLMDRETRGLSSSQSPLLIPNLFDVNNGTNKPGVSESYNHRKMNSLYGSAQINYGGWVFLDATVRKDWTSTLSPKNRDYVYPSVSLAWVITDMINKYSSLPGWLTFAKARVSYAEVGNDMGPYQLYNVYTMGTDNFGNPIVNSQGTLYNDDVKNELIKSWEAGLDMRFFDSRVGLDLSWYKTNATNQLINLPIAAIAYSSKKVNAGNIQNSGWEAVLNVEPIRSRDFLWRSTLNFSANKNKIIDLADGVEEYSLGGYDNLRIVAKVGGDYGDIYGSKYARVEDENSPHYGKLILNGDGLPTAAAGSHYLGNQNPVAQLGWINSFTWKDLTASFQVDARIGGKMFSGTLGTMENAGTAAWTVNNREKMVVDGVVKDGDNYVVNTKETTGEKYWQTISGRAGGNLGISEENLYDATNVRLRNVSIAYSLPKRLLAGQDIFQSIKLGFSCTNVFMIYSKMRGLDPESIFATSTNAIGFEYGAAPTSRAYVFNVSFGF